MISHDELLGNNWCFSNVRCPSKGQGVTGSALSSEKDTRILSFSPDRVTGIFTSVQFAQRLIESSSIIRKRPTPYGAIPPYHRNCALAYWLQLPSPESQGKS